MPANTSPIFTVTPNVSSVKIPTATAHVKADGTSSATGADFVYKAFTAGANGSYVDKIRFNLVASAAAVVSVNTVVRAFLSTVATPGATTAGDTYLLGEINIPTTASSHSTAATPNWDLIIAQAIPAGTYIHVSQHVTQTTNQSIQAIVFGGDY